MIDFEQMTDDNQIAETACEEWSNNEPAITTQEEELSFKEGIKRGLQYERKWQKEQMMAKAIDAHCFGFQGAALFSFRLPADNYLIGSKVKIIVIKED